MAVSNPIQKNYISYMFYGILFIAVQTFWVSVIWNKDPDGYLLEVGIIDITFVTATYILGWLFSRFLLVDLIVYLLSGILGLIVIEWIIAGHIPGTTEASQFVMFTTWAGTALFARIQTDKDTTVKIIRRLTFWLFILFAGIITAVGIISMQNNPKNAFAITYIAANYGYPLFMVLFILYIYRKLTTKHISP